MSTKELAMETIKGLPEDASWQEIEARIHLLAEVNLGYETAPARRRHRSHHRKRIPGLGQGQAVKFILSPAAIRDLQSISDYTLQNWGAEQEEIYQAEWQETQAAIIARNSWESLAGES